MFIERSGSVMKNALRAFLLLMPSIRVAHALPQETEQTDQSLDFKPIVDSLEKAASEHGAQRCASFVTALRIYRQIMRSNPVYGRDQDAGLALNWVDDVNTWDGMTAKDELQFIDEYIDAFGPVTVPTKITEMPLYVSDKSACLKDKRERP